MLSAQGTRSWCRCAGLALCQSSQAQRTRFHSALACSQLLLEFGATPNVLNKRGQSCIDVADNATILALLQDKTIRGTRVADTAHATTAPLAPASSVPVREVAIAIPPSTLANAAR